MLSRKMIWILGSSVFAIALTLVLALTLGNEKNTITFDSLGGQEYEEQVLSKGDNVVLPTPEKEGYIFIEWYFLEDEKEVVFTEDTIINRDLTVYARWQVITYSISFDSVGGSNVDTIENEYSVLPTSPDSPEKPGYLFEGWFLDSDYKTIYEFDYVPEDDLLLYAKWDVIVYDVIYFLDEGVNNEENLIQYTVETELVILKEPSKMGHSFVGWYNNPEFLGEAISSFSSSLRTDISLYAKWEINQYRIIDIDNEHDYLIELDFGEVIPELEPKFRFGYDFLGYYLDEGYQVLFDLVLMPAENVYVYPLFEPTVYQITYHLDGGENAVGNPETYTIETSWIVLAEPTKIGYSFLGWYFDAGFNGTAITELYTNSLLNRDLYAKWQINQYTISFETDGGSSLADLMLDYNEEIPLFLETEKKGYTFVSWYLDEHFAIEFDYLTMIDSDLVLYARWDFNQYEINYYRFNEDALYLDAYLEIGETVSKIFSGIYSSAFITSNNRIFIAGRNNGDGALAWSGTPLDVTDLFSLDSDEEIVLIVFQTFNTAALTSKSRVFTWGQNDYGQLGDGTLVESNQPIDITSNFDLNENEEIKLLSLGLYHGVVVTTDNRIFTWGRNNYSQLGDGLSVDKNLPVSINNSFLSLNEGVDELVCGTYHCGFRTSESRVFTWGRNSSGQLGNNQTEVVAVPASITGLLSLQTGESLVKLSMEGNSSAVLTSNGRVLVWGANSSGQLAEYTTTNRLTPSDVTLRFDLVEGDKIVNLHIGLSYSLFLSEKGRLFAVGSNYYGEFGNGESTSALLLAPIEITEYVSLNEDDGISGIFKGFNHTVVSTESGLIFAFGNNQYGQLGDETSTDRSSPVILKFELLVELVETQVYHYKEVIDLLTVERPGYIFSGWKVDKLRTINFILSEMPAEDIILFDAWQLIHYTIYYHLNDGYNSIYNPYGYNIEAGEIVLVDPFREDYIFGGWFFTDDFSGERVYSIPEGTIGDLDLYALWINITDNVESMMVRVGEVNEVYSVPIGANDLDTVSVNGGYYMATTETTYETWYWVVQWALNNDYHFQNLGTEGYDGEAGALPTSNNLPVVNISFRDVLVWLNAFSEMSGLDPVYRNGLDEVIKDARDSNAVEVDAAVAADNNGYRLPRKNEWEMAARWTEDTESVNGSILVGSRYWTPGSFASGAVSSLKEDLVDVAWYYHSFATGGPYVVQAVAGKAANALGLYDMSGNVGEMCFDVGSRSKTIITKGGSVITQIDGQISVSYEQSSSVVENAYNNIGFRIVRKG